MATNQEKKANILIADDHPYSRLGIKHEILKSTYVDAIFEAENGEEALKILSTSKIDLVLLDVKMPVLDGFDTAPIILEKHPHARVIMLSMFDDESLIINLIRMGIDGYILKNDSKLVHGLEQVLNGQFYISPAVEHMHHNAKQTTVSVKPIKMTPKEERLLPLLAKGKNSREIADALMLTKNTVESYRKELLAKFEVNNCIELVDFAHRTGRL
jgi:two-component system, NarL family, nitrate/nitrite response regulator NarL